MKKQSGQRIPGLSNAERIRKNEVWAKYKLSWKEYLALFEAQKAKCAICKQEIFLVSQGSNFISKRMACVDHCHTTGKVRGLLCSHCNKGLGLFRDDLVALRNAVEYLEK